MRTWFSADTKLKIKAAVGDVESRSGAEVVVAVRKEAGPYLHADLIGGAFAALIVLCVFLYHPASFDFTYFPLEQAVAFGLGAVLTRAFLPLRRVLSGAKTRASAVDRAAKAAFVDLGVTRTAKRHGVLVFVSAFEERVSVVPDIGLDVRSLGERWTNAVRDLERAVEAEDAVAFCLSLKKQLGVQLEALSERSEDDVNELPDDASVVDGAHAS